MNSALRPRSAAAVGNLCKPRFPRSAHVPTCARRQESGLTQVSDRGDGSVESDARRRKRKRSGLISQTLEGCRRGRSGVRPLRQPVGPRLLKNSQKMNPEHVGRKSGTLCHRTSPYSFDVTTTVILRRDRSTQPRPRGAVQHCPQAPYGNQAAHRSDAASIRLSTFVPAQQSEASGPH